MKREDEWGEATLRSSKIGGVYLGEEKNVGVHICSPRPRHYEQPPSVCFLHLP